VHWPARQDEFEGVQFFRWNGGALSKAASNSFPLLLANKDASLAQEEFVADVLRATRKGILP
jgi:hypothetical protein